jgi:N-acetylated-alpha-linked acidic dipeptidase
MNVGQRQFKPSADSQELEQQLLDAISLDTPWPVVEAFAGLVRTSGSAEERAALDILKDRLVSWGVPFTLHEPTCFISVPLEATVRIAGTQGQAFRAKTSAMSVSTDGAEIEGELIYIPAASPQATAGDVISATIDLGDVDVRGKIVITEGMPFPGKVSAVAAGGAKAGIFIAPGQNIHESICTTVWGTPDLDTIDRIPSIPVVAVNFPDGGELIAQAKQGARVALSTRLDTGWRPIPVLVAEIRGTRFPDEFVLLHGHLDSWHVGIGDNATGDATMLELARVFWQYRSQLDRTLRIAWWSGHSHGRYAGSTWYADTFALDLAKWCVAQVNCDSPGCRWTDTYNELSAMSETEPFVNQVIREVTGIAPQPGRPPRAGDFSFNGIGLSSFYMLTSTMSDKARAERDYYAVGGCGGNIAWHTEDDTLEIADRENLLRDMRMYGVSLLRVLNAPIHPVDWCQTTAEFRSTLSRYQDAAEGVFDFGSAMREIDALDASLQRFYAACADASVDQLERLNGVQRRLGRILIPVNYSRMSGFRHDPALNVPPLPDLAPALAAAAAKDDPEKNGVLTAHLQRGMNRLIWALVQARETVANGIA